MKYHSLIRKKYSVHNIQILSKYELQKKFESIQGSITSSDILSDLPFFKEISQYFDSSNIEKAFTSFKFTLYCYLLTNFQETEYFQNLFIKYIKIFIKTCHKYYSFVIIRININNIFNETNEYLSVNEFNKIINNLLEEYKKNPYKSIISMNIHNFIKNDINKSFFFLLVDSFKFAFDREQINAISKYIVDNSIYIIKKLIADKSSKISYFKKINNIIQFHIKEISNIITNNNSKKKCTLYMSEFFKSIINIYNEIIKLFEMGLYNFYGNDFIVGYIHKNLIVTIMQFLENKYFVLNEKIISTIIDLSNNIETFLVNNLKINEKKDFIEYSWIMSQFFNFLYHAEDKTESINYGSKIINLYKNKSFISIPIISIKITLYEYYLKNQKENYSEYDTDEHLNNISELLIMFSKCEIEGEINEKYLIKMINHLFKLLTDHIIYIINNRPIQVRNIYNILISINPFMINCRDISNNKNIITKIHLFNIFCSLSNIITNNESNNNEIYENDIYYYINNIDKKLSKEDKKLFINIMSVLIVYDKNFHQKIFEILIALYKLDDYNQFLEVFFNFCYQLDKMENYNTIVLFDLLNILKNFLNEKFNEKNKKNYNDIIIKFKNNYFGIYKAYVYNAIKYAYESILTINKNEKNKKFDVDDDIDSNGLHIKISKSIKLLNKFIEIHNSIIEYFYKIVEIESYNNQSIYYLPYNLIINYFLELIDCSNESSSKNIIFIYQQIYLIGINESLFSSLPIYIQNFIYYILYRLIHNIYNVINNRDLFLIK